jgi:FAD/FMN-containing dehydrogenase
MLGEPMIDSIAIAALQRRMRGELIAPNAAGYDVARRLVNGRFDRRPALIARCQGAEDVAQAVMFAREYGLEIAVRSGGHSVPGFSVGDGVMMIDLSAMRQIDVDPARKVARVQPGATNGELVVALQGYGLTTTTGTCASVGMGGSTLGGGIGWLMGRFGMTIDNVLAFELVTADGEILNVSANEHPDLFWALRGGGGNFGVVTAFIYRVYELGPVFGGMAIFHLATAPLALRMYRQITSAAPDELLAHAVLASVPDFGPALVVQAVYSGADMAEGERVLAPLRRFGPPAIDLIAQRSYADLYMMLTPPLPPHVSYHDTAYTLRQPSDAALDMLVAVAAERPTPTTLINIHQVHGAATRVAPGATAFALREPHYSVVNIGMWMEGDGELETQWTWEAHQRMAPFASPGIYVNFLGEEGEAKIRESYRANYDRLAAIKARYDRDNVFHRNQNIKPAA